MFREPKIEASAPQQPLTGFKTGFPDPTYKLWRPINPPTTLPTTLPQGIAIEDTSEASCEASCEAFNLVLFLSFSTAARARNRNVRVRANSIIY